MSKERTGQRHKNKIYFKDQDLDLYLQAFPLNFQTYGGAAEVLRVLKPGGRLLLLDHVRSPMLAVRLAERLLAPVAEVLGLRPDARPARLP